MSTEFITLKPRGRTLNGLPLELPKSTSPAALYDLVAGVTRLSIQRLRISKEKDGSDVVARTSSLLGSEGHNELFVKDLGPQISWRDVYIIEYVGALLVHPIMYTLRLSHPSSTQRLLLLLVTGHFVKRELETMFVHRFSNATMPLRNLFKNSFHYWILSGLFLAWAFYAPTDAASSRIEFLECLGTSIFLAGEVGNLYTHLVLRSLRPSGTTKRQVPQGFGFGWVTCPNYMFETVAWLGILMISRSWAVILFLFVAVVQMRAWAWKKEMRYRREFPDSYKSKKSVVLPGIC